MTDYNVLSEPLSLNKMRALSKKGSGGFIKGVVKMELSELIENDLEGVLDIMSERLTGGPLLCEINYRVVGHEEETTLHIEVSGDPSMIIEEEAEAQFDDDDAGRSPTAR